MKTIIHIVGNRPQFIKLSVLHKEISRSNIFSQKIIHTGQHLSYQMSGAFFSELAIPSVDVQLNCTSHQTDIFIAKASELLQEYLALQKNCLVLVYGDTNSTLAAAIASARKNIPLFHFEAGIRTGDKSMPEEINRIITDRLAHTNYCCTGKNYAAMIAEGYGSSIGRVLQSGDLMYDAFLQIRGKKSEFSLQDEYVVATIHRASNILSPVNLSAVINALNKLHKNIPVVMPLHPHTQKRILEYGLTTEFSVREPVGYSQMQNLLSGASFIITDSGGISREAFFNQKKSLIIMEKPFWPEIIEAGCGINVAANALCIEEGFAKLSSLDADFSSPIFGVGTAAEFINKDLTKFYSRDFSL